MTWTPSPMPSETPSKSTAFIVLGVCGGIAAYKSVEVLRQLRDRGYDVAPVLTTNATNFVGALTFSALASEPTRTSLFGDATTPIPHTYLGQRADLVVVAPATAHFIARLAAGLANDLLSATVLATRAPVVLCPAMHTEMWEQPSVRANIATVKGRGFLVLGPDSGPLAGGDAGVGRMVEPPRIVELVERCVSGFRGELTGRRVLITAGGTREAIDPVRVIANRSTGLQGYALAEVARRLGAEVTLVSTVDRSLSVDVASSIKVVAVESAREMRDAVANYAPSSHCVIMAAAVSDFTIDRSPQKLRRRDGLPELRLKSTDDIVRELVTKRPPGQVIVAFAAETGDLVANALAKFRDKGVDVLVANDVSAPGVGFGHPTNEVTIVGPGELVEHVARAPKDVIAYAILARVAELLPRGDS